MQAGNRSGGKYRALVAASIGALMAIPLLTGAGDRSALNGPASGFLWVGETKEVLSIRVPDGMRIFRQDAAHLEDIAVDTARQAVWTAGKREIVKYDWSGGELARFVLPVPSVLRIKEKQQKKDPREQRSGGGNRSHEDDHGSLAAKQTHISLDSSDGSLWVGTGNWLMKLSADGHILWKKALQSAVVDVSVKSGDGSCWVALTDHAMHYAPAGQLLLSIRIERGNHIAAIVADPREDGFWIGSKKGLIRLTDDGRELFRKTDPRDIKDMKADPSRGGVWLITKKQVFRFDMQGKEIFRRTPCPEGGERNDHGQDCSSWESAHDEHTGHRKGRDEGGDEDNADGPGECYDNMITLAVDPAGDGCFIAWRKTVLLLDSRGLAQRWLQGFEQIEALDAIPPALTVAITSPESGAIIERESISVQGTVSDTAARVTVNGREAVVDSGVFTASEVPLALGENTLTARASNAAQLVSTATVTVTRRTLLPPLQVRISAPRDGESLTTSRVTVTGTVNDPGAAVVVNGVQATVSGNVFTAHGIPLNIGGNAITVSALDTHGQAASDSVSVKLTWLSLSVTSPEPGQEMMVSPITVMGIVSDVKAYVEVNGREASVSADGTFSAANVKLVEGWNGIIAQASNREGQSAVAEVQVNRPRLATVYTDVRVLAPKERAVVSAPTFTVFGVVSDSRSEVIVNDVPAKVSGNLFSAMVHACESPGEPLYEGGGNCLITVSMYTRDGETVTRQSTYTYDPRQDPFRVGITNLPRQSTTTTREIEVRGKIHDPHADYEPVWVRVNNAWADVSGDTFVVRVQLQEGVNYLSVDAANLAGEQAWDAVEVIYEDPGKPLHVWIGNPVNGMIVNRPAVPVSGYVSDSAASVTINGVTADRPSLSGFGLPAVALAEGENVITAVATRPGGEALSMAVSVTYDPTYPSPPAPRLATAPEYVRTPTVEVSGVAQPVQWIEILLNGSSNTWIRSNADGLFSAAVANLQEGLNRIMARASDGSGNLSGFSNEVSVVRDTIRPWINIELVAESLNLAVSRVILLGSTEAHAVVTVDIDGEPGYKFQTTADENGGFYRNLVLSAGRHSISALAIDRAGNRQSKSRIHTVYAPYSSTPLRPRMDPLPSPVNATTIAVEGQAYARFRIALFRNNEFLAETVTDARGRFRFDAVGLVPGINILKVRQLEDQINLGPSYVFLKSADSEEQAVDVVAGPAAHPTVKVLFPRDGSVTNAAHLPLRGSIDAPNAWLSATGSYNSAVTGAWNRNGRFAGYEAIPLLPGRNTLWVAAVGPDGSRGVDKVTVTYEPPADVPQVSINSPTEGAEVYERAVAVAGTAGPGTMVVVNETEAATSGEMFNAAIDLFNIGYAYRPDQGRGVISAWAMDNDGRIGLHEVRTSYRYVPVPAISLDLPADGQIFDSPRALFSGTVSDGIEMSVNGMQVELTRGVFSQAMDLTEGRNSFNIVAKNGPKASARTVEVYYLPGAQVSLASVTLAPDPLHIPLGKGKLISATGTYSNGQTTDLTRTCSWSSSDETVATVNRGYVQSRRWGRATVTAQCGTFTREVMVAVTEAVIEELQVAYEVVRDGKAFYAFDSPMVNPGDKVNFRAVGWYANGKMEDLTASAQWTSSDPAVAAPDARGAATAIGLGSATITAKYNDIVGSNRLSVVNPPVTLVITSPVENEQFDRDRVTVQGAVFSKANEVGVRVNGVPATVSGSRFVANRVPVPLGSSVIKAEALDTNGVTAEARVIVTRYESGNPLRLAASIESGIGPLETVLRIDGVPQDTAPDIKASGPGSVEFLDCSSMDSCKIRMTAIGVYTITVTSVGYDGNTYSDSIDITVLDRAKLDALLQAKWEGMKGKLAVGDIGGAVSHFIPYSRDRYSKIFSAIGRRLPILIQNMQDIQMIYAHNGIAKYRIRKNELHGGQMMTLTYYIYFTTDSDGYWAIDKY